ncbi:MAG TPA: DEAD/DEAH box helicase [Stellaceae bacterium]|nr:DEAD/DEAH box helicase [Stellaceae bacterium]
MSRPAAAARQKPEPTIRRARFAEEDLVSTFGEAMLAEARRLLRAGAVNLAAAGPAIEATIEADGQHHRVALTPTQRGARVDFPGTCEPTSLPQHRRAQKPALGEAACVHRAAAALAALERDPTWRRPVQHSLFDLAGSAATFTAVPKRRIVFALEPGSEDQAVFVSVFAETVERGVRAAAECNPAAAAGETDAAGRALCRLLDGADQHRIGVAASQRALVDRVVEQTLATGHARWAPSGAPLVRNFPREFRALRSPRTGRPIAIGLSKGSAIIEGTIAWYVDAQSGAVGRARLIVSEPRHPGAARAGEMRGRPNQPSKRDLSAAPAVIVEGKPVPHLTLFKATLPAGTGAGAAIDVAQLRFLYGEIDGEASVDPEDERQFARNPDGVFFYRRDRAGEAAALDRLRQCGLSIMRLAAESGSRGARIFLFHGRDLAERWQAFIATALPALENAGWQIEIAAEFGTRPVEAGSEWQANIADTGDGWFSLDMGIDVEGERVPLLPILVRLLERGGIEGMPVADGWVHAPLNDGRLVALPTERVGKLLAVIAEMADAGRLTAAGAMVLPAAEAASVIDLEPLATMRWENAAAIRDYARKLQGGGTSPRVPPPPDFAAALRPYQQQGLDWLQDLRASGMAGILADDMGLGKTAQTLAHIAVERAAGRLDRPALVVVPTSLVANWMAEAAKFTPNLRLVLWHGLDRFERREEVGGADLVVTTYTVLARDIEIMRGLKWHLVVLDESQAIKNPEAKWSRAVRQLNARHQLCLSGTPVENNLGEIWSQFAFLMPGLLGDRRGFVRRFRTPIEKNGDDARRLLLARRLKPFLLRRTKSEVEADLPAKTEIVQRVLLEGDQRDLYETIRLTTHEKVRREIAAHSLERSQIIVLDALLKLRQVCCDPRLVKLAAMRKALAGSRAGAEVPAAPAVTSSKLVALMQMLRELASEGRRVLVFSQFTSMLDLIKPELAAADIGYVELTGAIRDRAGPISRFQSGAVPVFLISLKAGGRGLNLTAADTVIHYDPWWNPAVENQATDRAHRIGQTKPVFVYKLIAAGTVEERIVELQEKKGRLAAATLEARAAVGGLAAEDLDYLFGE